MDRNWDSITATRLGLKKIKRGGYSLGAYHHPTLPGQAYY